MKTKFLKLDYFTYCVKFAWASTNGHFIFQGAEGLLQIMKENPENKGIEFIKVFDNKNNKFVRISNKDFYNQTKFNTEAWEELQKLTYFNNLKF